MALQKLNPNQQQAVDMINGPLMVVAGPGTGKTELLSRRVASILSKTDTLPENILCLTFTESGAEAMRQRLVSIIDKEAYRVAIHTFHSFGNEVINQNSEFFFSGADFTPASEIEKHEVLESIFNKLDPHDAIAKKMNDEFVYLKDAQKAISDFKRSGFRPDEIEKILDENQPAIDDINKLFSPLFADRLNIKIIPKLHQANGKIADNNPTFTNITPLTKVFKDSLSEAISLAEDMGKTVPIRVWRDKWFKKNSKSEYELKSTSRQNKLRSAVSIYDGYLTKMQSLGLYDYDDMILKVTQAIEVFPELKYNLQEKYQYIMVDEFQDTNMAQMKIIHNLADDPIDKSPNIMVVGDDDQAIYSFQGADVSNILNFMQNYPKAKLINLTENYRSHKTILDGSHQLISQGKDRLENKIDELDKTLKSNHKGESSTKIYQADSIIEERHWLIGNIKSRLKNGEEADQIAVITRKHSEIEQLLPYFADAKIKVNYERRDNVLELEPIILVEKIAKVMLAINTSNLYETNVLLPEILAHPAFDINSNKLWRVSLSSYRDHKTWLEAMEQDKDLEPIFAWLIELAKLSNTITLEEILDLIIGQTSTSDYTSPLFEHFFSSSKLDSRPDDYVIYLEALRTIRNALREHRPDRIHKLADLVDFIEANRKIKATISLVRPISKDKQAINLMTAHKSKGLEFKTVYITNVTDNIWGLKQRSPISKLDYPENLTINTAGSSEDDKLRLFFVAATRAKNNLNISYSLSDRNSKPTMIAYFLSNSLWPIDKLELLSKSDEIEATKLAWYQPIISPISTDLKQTLSTDLENYKLSVTHLNNFIDIVNAGPEVFLLNNLLRFPKAKSPNASYGTAIHTTLQNAHNYIRANQKKQTIDDILIDFDSNLRAQYLSEQDYKSFLKKGNHSLELFLKNNYDNFKPDQMTELNFNNQSVIIGESHITGKLDVVDIDEKFKTISVIDYKTGKPSNNWRGRDEYEKIKLHKYRQQLLFYKLLIENSRDYHGYHVDSLTMQFIEPDESGQIHNLVADFSQQEIGDFKILVSNVFNKIINLDLPDTNKYPTSYKGILEFEKDLIDQNT